MYVVGGRFRLLYLSEALAGIVPCFVLFLACGAGVDGDGLGFGESGDGSM